MPLWKLAQNAVLFAGFACACAADEHPPRADADPPASQGGTSNAAGGPGGGTGGAGTGAAPAAWAGGTSAHCDRFDPDKVYLLGHLTDGEAQRSIAAPSRPAEICSTLITDKPVLLDTLTESVLYVNAEDGALWIFRSDAFWRAPGSTAFVYDPSPESNDDPLLPPCGRGELRAMVEPDTGALWSSCDGESYFDRNGELLPLGGAELLHLGYDQYRLGIDASGELVIVTPTGGVVPSSGCSGDALLTVRARPTGFWLVTGNPSALMLESVDTDGRCETIGPYATLPASSTGSLEVAIDAEGNVYQLGQGPGGNDVVIERAHPPGPTSVIYDEADAPAGGQDWENLRLYLRIERAQLFTGG